MPLCIFTLTRLPTLVHIVCRHCVEFKLEKKSRVFKYKYRFEIPKEWSNTIFLCNEQVDQLGTPNRFSTTVDVTFFQIAGYMYSRVPNN